MKGGGTMSRVKWFIVEALDVIGFRVFFEFGSWLIGCSDRLDKRWNTGVWKEWRDDDVAG